MKNSTNYYIGILLLPSCFILCFLEALYHFDGRTDLKTTKNFYFIKSLDWVVHLEEKGVCI